MRDSFSFYLSTARQLRLLVFSKNDVSEAGRAFECGTCGSNVDELVSNHLMREWI